MKRISLSHGKGSFVIEAEALLIGDDLVVALWGGSVPHVGAVAMAIPRPSLQDKSVISATSSVLTSPGHKEDEIVKWFSEKVSAALDGTVVVSAGMHWENLTGEDIGTIRTICEELCGRLIAEAREAAA
jgi:hypothetical protein